MIVFLALTSNLLALFSALAVWSFLPIRPSPRPPTATNIPPNKRGRICVPKALPKTVSFRTGA